MTKETQQTVQIAPPRLKTVKFKIIGTSPLMILRFSQKAQNMMADKMKAGSQAKGKKVREARDFDEDFEQAKYVSTEGWNGINASSFRNALISACRLVGFKMTLAKLSVFIEADGFDKVNGLPLVRVYGDAEPNILPVRNATGVADLRCRALWREWHCFLNVTFDEDQFSLQDVTNLLMRVGMQGGIGEGRNDSKQSAGLGFGLFKIEQAKK